jgi:site-specific recombinase XerD
MEEGLRKDNPAQQTRRPRRRPAMKSRLTEREVLAILEAARGRRERRAIFLGACAGLRNAELRGLQGRHFARDGVVWVSADIAKGKRERTLPVIPDLRLVVEEIRANVAVEEYVLPAQRFRNPPANTERQNLRLQPSSPQALIALVMRVAAHAEIATHVTPHDLRHAYAEHIARNADTRIAQHLLGHANLGTTDVYLGHPRLDDMVAAVKDATHGMRTNVLGVAQMAYTARKGQFSIPARAGFGVLLAGFVRAPCGLVYAPSAGPSCHWARTRSEPLYCELKVSHKTYEGVHDYWRDRYKVCADELGVRPKAVGLDWHRLRANVACLIDWLRIAAKNDWLDIARTARQAGERRFKKTGERVASDFAKMRIRMGLAGPYGPKAAKLGIGDATPPPERPRIRSKNQLALDLPGP